MSLNTYPTVITCNKNSKTYLCKRNHKNCQDCILYKGVSRTTIKQYLPSLQTICNVCGEVSVLNQTDVTLKRERLNNAIEKLYKEKEYFYLLEYHKMRNLK